MKCVCHPTRLLVFPRLESLTLFNCTITPLFFTELLQPSVLPALQVVASTALINPHTSLYYFPQLGDDPSLFSRLPFIQLHQDVTSPLKTSQQPVPILLSQPVDMFVDVLSLPFLHHLHLRPPRSFNSDGSSILRSLQSLIDALPSLPLKTLTLPTASSPLHLGDLSGQRALRRLVAACEEHGVEVLWEEAEGAVESAFCVNERFWRWAKEKKAQKEQQ
jgi:hypothetical protein